MDVYVEGSVHCFLGFLKLRLPWDRMRKLQRFLSQIILFEGYLMSQPFCNT